MAVTIIIAMKQVWKTGLSSPLESPRALSDDLPQFSLSPLSYITEVHLPSPPPSLPVMHTSNIQIGDCLLTLPHQLEPFTSQENPALNHALQHGILPFPDDRGVMLEEEGEPHPSDQWLGAVARGTMITYTQHILHIPSLPPLAAHQLATDIGMFVCACVECCST